MQRRILRGLFCAGLAFALVANPAAAESTVPTKETESSKALARSLFEQGLEAMRVGGCEVAPAKDDVACAEAADAFRKVVELSPGSLGALRNLALVEVSRGRIATGAALWRELAERAAATTDPKYAGWAERAVREAEQLSQRVPLVRIELGSLRPDTLSIDGASVPIGVGVLPLDPGRHVVVAKAAGAEDFVQSFSVREGETLPLAVELQAQAPDPPLAQEGRDGGRAQRRGPPVGPLVLGGAGAGLAVAGLGLGYSAWRGRRDACGNTDHCEPDGLDRTLKLARASNAVTAAGAAAAGAAVVWSLVRARGRRVTFEVELSPMPGARVTTRW